MTAKEGQKIKEILLRANDALGSVVDKGGNDSATQHKKMNLSPGNPDPDDPFSLCLLPYVLGPLAACLGVDLVLRLVLRFLTDRHGVTEMDGP